MVLLLWQQVLCRQVFKSDDVVDGKTAKQMCVQRKCPTPFPDCQSILINSNCIVYQVTLVFLGLVTCMNVRSPRD